MKKSPFTDQQIAFAVQQAAAGVAFEEVCRIRRYKRGVLSW